MNSVGSSALRAAATAVVSIVCAVGAWLGFLKLTEPEGFEARRAEIETRLAHADRLVLNQGPASRFRSEAVCSGVSDADLSALQQGLSVSAAQAGVTLTDLAASSEEARRHGSLAPVALRLQGAGPYPAVMALLGRLSEGRPELFVERLTLEFEAPNVSLELHAKVFCWTYASP